MRPHSLPSASQMYKEPLANSERGPQKVFGSLPLAGDHLSQAKDGGRNIFGEF